MKRPLESKLLFDEEGNPEGRFLPVDVIIVPSGIELSNDGSCLEVADEEEYWYGIGDERLLSTNCLSQFLQLASQPPAGVLRFARRWGMLGLCSHGQPATHNIGTREGRERSPLLPYRGCTPAPSEKISDWLTYSTRFRTIIEVAQRLHRGERIDDDSVWEVLGRPRRAWVVGGSGDSLPWQKKRFARAVNLQLAASGIQPVMYWHRVEPVLGFGVFGGLRTSLFAALCMQLAMTVSDCKIAICSWCHKTYMPNRRTHAGNANYCSTCREAGVDVRVRVQRLRDRRREG